MEFVNSHHADDFKSRAARETVRSHVSRRQHQMTRDSARPFTFTPPLYGPRPEHIASPKTFATTPEPSGYAMLKPGPDGLRMLKARTRKPRRKGNGDNRSSTGIPNAEPPTGASGNDCKVEAVESPAPTSDNAASCSLGEPSLVLGAIEEYMQEVFEPLGWPALGISETQGMIWQSYMADQSKVEPALRYTRLLFGAAILCQHNVLRREVLDWLHGRAVSVIRNGLLNRKVERGEALIISVGSLAFYESMFGDARQAHSRHRPEQQRLIAMKGGLDELTMPQVVKRIMIWEDLVMARQSNSVPLLSIDQDMGEHGTWNALAIWLPDQYAALMDDFDDGAMGQD